MGEVNRERFENEKLKIATLMAHPHPHILAGVRIVAEGIFLARMNCTLSERLDQAKVQPLDLQTKWKWEHQLEDALAWLESLEIVHGDLRPINVFLDKVESVRKEISMLLVRLDRSWLLPRRHTATSTTTTTPCQRVRRPSNSRTQAPSIASS